MLFEVQRKLLALKRAMDLSDLKFKSVWKVQWRYSVRR